MEIVWRETSETFQMGVSDFLFFCIQYGSYRVPVSGIYIYAGMAGAGTRGDGVYVAAERNAYLGCRFYMESVGI